MNKFTQQEETMPDTKTIRIGDIEIATKDLYDIRWLYRYLSHYISWIVHSVTFKQIKDAAAKEGLYLSDYSIKNAATILIRIGVVHVESNGDEFCINPEVPYPLIPPLVWD